MTKAQNKRFCEKKQVEVGNRIHKLRREKGITLEKLAERSNLSVQSICKIESGERNIKISTLISLSQALGVSADYILGLSNYCEEDNIFRLISSLSPTGKEFIKGVVELYLISEQ